MSVFSVWDIQVFIQFFSWNSQIQKLLWFYSWIYHNHWTSCLSYFWNFLNEIFHWCKIVFSLLLCWSDSWWSAWLYLFLFQADKTAHSCAHSFELVIVWTSLWFCQTDLIFQSSDSAVNVALQAVQCMSAFELEFEQNCLLILSHLKLFCWKY